MSPDDTETVLADPLFAHLRENLDFRKFSIALSILRHKYRGDFGWSRYSVVAYWDELRHVELDGEDGRRCIAMGAILEALRTAAQAFRSGMPSAMDLADLARRLRDKAERERRTERQVRELGAQAACENIKQEPTEMALRIQFLIEKAVALGAPPPVAAQVAFQVATGGRLSELVYGHDWPAEEKKRVDELVAQMGQDEAARKHGEAVDAPI